jgi:hypothetical protein
MFCREILKRKQKKWNPGTERHKEKKRKTKTRNRISTKKVASNFVHRWRCSKMTFSIQIFHFLTHYDPKFLKNRLIYWFFVCQRLKNTLRLSLYIDSSSLFFKKIFAFAQIYSNWVDYQERKDWRGSHNSREMEKLLILTYFSDLSHLWLDIEPIRGYCLYTWCIMPPFKHTFY